MLDESTGWNYFPPARQSMVCDDEGDMVAHDTSVMNVLDTSNIAMAADRDVTTRDAGSPDKYNKKQPS